MRAVMALPALILLFSLYSYKAVAQVPVPARYDGFLYKADGAATISLDAVVIEAFLDPICGDSRDAWLPLKKAFDYYAPHITLLVHPFPLPYHDNAYVACRALHVAHKVNASATFPLLELLFHNQEKFYNSKTHYMTRRSIVTSLVELAGSVIGKSSLSDFEHGFQDYKTDAATIISFKYGCSRSVTGTPYFFVNGIPLPGSGSALDYEQWRSILDPLLGDTMESEEIMFSIY